LPLVLTMTGTDINFDLWGAHREVVLQGMRKVQRIVVFNQDFLSTLALAYPEFQDKLHSIPQGIQLEAALPIGRQQLGLQESDFVFVLPSGLRRVKNIELALDALSHLWQENKQIRLLVLGTAIEENYSKMILKRINNLPWVTYLGEIPHDQVKAYYQQGDVVLNTSLAEGQPQAALEVMSLAKPVILTTVPGNLGIIQDGVHGFYARNQAEIQEAGRKLILNHKLKENMGQAAAQLVQQEFTAQNEFNAYAVLYRQILTGAGG